MAVPSTTTSPVEDWLNRNIAAPIFDAAGNVIGYVGGKLAQYGLATPGQVTTVTSSIGATIGTIYSTSQGMAQGVEGNTYQAFNAAGQLLGTYVPNALGNLFRTLELPVGLFLMAAGAFVLLGES